MSSRVTAWAAVATLLLKSAVPLLASTAAQLQGKSVAEVCSVYGVDLGVRGATPHDPHAHHHAHGAGATEPHRDGEGHTEPSHGSDHCALSALGGGLPSDLQGWQVPATPVLAPSVERIDLGQVEDASARWAARLHHGPPRSA